MLPCREACLTAGIVDGRPQPEVRLVDVLQRLQILVRQREAMRLGQVRFDLGDVCGEPRPIRSGRLAETAPQRINRPHAIDTVRHRHREQAGDELDAIGRQLEQRLEEQVLHDRLTPDVEDEADRGTDGGDVMEVLFGTDAEVGATVRPGLRQRRGRVRKVRLVRREVVRVKRATRF